MTIVIITLHFHLQRIYLQNICGSTGPNLLCIKSICSHSPSPLEESKNRLLLFLFSSCFIWMSLSVCVILLFYPPDAMKLNVMYVCGIFVMHGFCKAVLVFLSFLQSKTSGLVAHENSTF